MIGGGCCISNGNNEIDVFLLVMMLLLSDGVLKVVECSDSVMMCGLINIFVDLVMKG